MDIKKMVIKTWTSDEIKIRFKYYGDFETIRLIYDDCKNDLFYVGVSNTDSAPIFIYTFKNFNEELLYDIKKLNFYLRNLKIRNLTKKDLNDEEKSILSFLRFFMYNLENKFIKGAYELEVIYNSDYN